MSLYKNFVRTTTLLLTLSPIAALAEGDEARQVYVPSCSEAQTKGAYCLEKTELKLVKEESVWGDDENGNRVETGTRLVNKNTSKDDLYQILASTGQNAFAGLKDCKDASVPPGMVCISDYGYPRNEKGKKMKDQAKIPTRIGMVRDRNEDGSNRFSDLNKQDLQNYLFRPSSEGGGGFLLTSTPKLNLPKEALKVTDADVPPPPVVEEVKAPVEQPKDIDCGSSARQQLNYPYKESKDAAIRKYLEVQGKLTHLRIQYAYLSELSKTSKKHEAEKRQIEDQIIALVREKNAKSQSAEWKEVHASFEKAPLTNRTKQLLADKNLDALLKSAKGIKGAHLALGHSDLKYLTWSTEGSAPGVLSKSLSLQLAGSVDAFLKDQKGSTLKPDELKASVGHANDVLGDSVAAMLNAKAGCHESSQCSAFYGAPPVKGKKAGEIQAIVSAYNKQVLIDPQLSPLRSSDKLAKGVMTSQEQAVAKAKAESTTVTSTSSNAANSSQNGNLIEKKDEKLKNNDAKVISSSGGTANRSTAATQNYKTISFQDLNNQIHFMNNQETLKFGDGCKVTLNSKTYREPNYLYNVTAVAKDGTKKDFQLATWPDESSEFGQFRLKCHPAESKAREEQSKKDAAYAKALQDKNSPEYKELIRKSEEYKAQQAEFNRIALAQQKASEQKIANRKDIMKAGLLNGLKGIYNGNVSGTRGRISGTSCYVQVEKLGNDGSRNFQGEHLQVLICKDGKKSGSLPHQEDCDGSFVGRFRTVGGTPFRQDLKANHGSDPEQMAIKLGDYFADIVQKRCK